MPDGETTIIKQFSERADALRKPTSILVVDDNADDIKMVSRIFKELPEGRVQWDICESGPEALALMKANTYDLIMLDVRMPYMNGVDVIKKMKEFGLTQRVALMTGLTNGPLVSEALQLGAVMHILKPVTSENLKQMLQLLRL